MIVSEKQIQGMVAICLIVSIITFVCYYRLFLVPELPVFVNQSNDSLAIKIVKNSKEDGIYFVDSEKTFSRLLTDIDISGISFFNLKLENGIKININSLPGNRNISVAEMSAAEKLALGMRLDLNQVSEEELQLVKGIGEITAKEIINLRKHLGRFENVTHLMEIKGIKERKLADLRKYLYVGKCNQ